MPAPILFTVAGEELVPLVPPIRTSDKGGQVELRSDQYGCQPPLQEQGESNGCFIVCLPHDFKGSAGTNYLKMLTNLRERKNLNRYVS